MPPVAPGNLPICACSHSVAHLSEGLRASAIPSRFAPLCTNPLRVSHYAPDLFIRFLTPHLCGVDAVNPVRKAPLQKCIEDPGEVFHTNGSRETGRGGFLTRVTAPRRQRRGTSPVEISEQQPPGLCAGGAVGVSLSLIPGSLNRERVNRGLVPLDGGTGGETPWAVVFVFVVVFRAKRVGSVSPAS